MKLSKAIILSILLFIGSKSNAATVFFEDDFDQGNIDNWNLIYSSHPVDIATSSNPPFNYYFTASSLVIDQVYNSTPYPVSDVLLTQVRLSHLVDVEIADYTLSMDFSWTMNSTQDGQQIFIGAATADGYAKVGMADMYTHTLGEYGNNEIFGQSSPALGNVTQLSSSATVKLTRENDVISAYWNDTLVSSKIGSSSPLVSINIDLLDLIKYWTHENLTFGSVSIDSVSFQGETIESDAIPEPASVLLLGLSLIGVIRKLRR